MRIACPACETAYDVPDSVLTAGRVMRCARCRGEWAPQPVTQAVAADLVADMHTRDMPSPKTPAPEMPRPEMSGPEMIVAAPPDEDPLPFLRPPSPPQRRAKPAVLGAWVASLAVLMIFIWSFISWREPIIRHWPPAARLYQALGFRKV